jgi:uncharacterized phiE125 gp8 family phage protein
MSDAPLFIGQHDPADVADYVIRFDDVMDSTETLTLVGVTIDATSAGLGLALGTASYAATAIARSVKFWLTCTDPTNAAFAAGVLAVVTATCTTSNNPARTFQRAVLVRVAQSEVLLAPVTVAEAKNHLRVVDNSEDDYIAGLVKAAADLIERDTGLALRAKSYTDSFETWQQFGRNRLPLSRRPANSVTQIEYDGDVGGTQVLASNQYRLRDLGGSTSVVPAANVTWPTLEAIPGAVRVTYNAGYANNDALPAAIRHAAMLLISHWYEHREAATPGTVTTLPMAYDSLIAAYRIVRLG